MKPLHFVHETQTTPQWFHERRQSNVQVLPSSILEKQIFHDGFATQVVNIHLDPNLSDQYLQ